MAYDKLIRLEASLHINSQMKEFRNRSYKAASNAIRTVSRNARDYAKQNVAKGKGPGPHPHRWPYVDTGDLAKSIGMKVVYNGVRMESVVYTELDYGTYLEVGWRAKNGRFYRYPWLKPAWRRAMDEYKTIAARSWKEAMVGLGDKGVRLDGPELEATSGHYEHMANLTRKWQDIEDAGVMSREQVTRMVNFAIDPEISGHSARVGSSRESAIETLKRMRDATKPTLPKVKPPTRRHDSRRDNREEAARQRVNVKFTPPKPHQDLEKLKAKYQQERESTRKAKQKIESEMRKGHKKK